MKKLYQILSEANTEEEVKNFFAKFFHIKLSTKNFIDLYTPQILFEFKFDSNLENIQTRAKIIAQTLYYVRRLKFGSDFRSPSQNICIVTKNFAALFPTEIFAEFYDDKTRYDWDLAPSSPCKILVNDLSNAEPVINAHIFDFSVIASEISFSTLINNTLKNKSCAVKKINETNFEQIFLYWQKLFGNAVKNGRKPSEYFIIDIEQGKSEDLKNGVLFRMNSGELVEKFIKPDKYRDFWALYEKILNPNDIIAIRQKMDRMTEINLRRRTGEFYTPKKFADKAIDYLTRTVGEWWKDKNFRLWDMAAGTGNLEFNLPVDALKFCYISTLLDDDAAYCKKIFPDATVFQYDYLNDDQNKLPANLRADLNNPNIKWIIFINPPYATANNYERDKSKITKDGLAMTEIRKIMTENDMGKASQELFSQFLYRISRDFADRQAWLGIFSKIKYINANADQQLRDKFFQYKFERGFVFNSKSFDGCKAQFPVGFLIWNLSDKIPLESQEISLDIYNSDVEKVAEKTFHSTNANETLNKWIERPRRTKKFPPMTSGINIQHGKIHCDTVSEDFLADLMSMGNDFLHQNYTSILSGVYSGGHDISITPENFEQSMIVHMVRRLPKATWLNDRDQFMQPTKNPLPEEFITDAVIWSLFSPSNQTVSLRNVEYEGEIYRMKNNFYPFMLSEVREWFCSSPEIRMQLARATEDRFAAKWIKNHGLSTEARAVLDTGREIYKIFYASLNVFKPALEKYKIKDWDAGWYQIRMTLSKFPDEDYTYFQMELKKLSKKLLPQIYELGFLRDEVRYFT